MNVYIDTSALAKWYVNEAGSEEVEAFLLQSCPVYISILTKVEMKSMLARRVRLGHIDAEVQGRILAAFESDVISGHLVLVPHPVDAFLAAETLLGATPDVPLVTLDTLHLGVMRANGLTTLATADQVMASAAASLGLECRTFFEGISPV